MADEFSGSDSDDGGLQEDMESLKRACSFAGNKPLSSTAAGISDGSSSDSDDLELLRKIQRRFSASDEAQKPLNLKPICTLPPVFGSDSDDDCNDDFEILRAVQRRFMDFDNDSPNESTGDGLWKPQVGDSTIDSEKETSSNLSIGRTNIAEEFPDPVDGRITRHVSESSPDISHGNQISDFFEGHESGVEYNASSPVNDSSFPKSAQAFIDAIKKNRSCQKYLRSKLMQIESKIEENTKLRNRIKTLKDFQYCCRRKTGQELSQKKDARIQLIQVPKLRANAKVKDKITHVMYSGPPENSHVPNYSMVLQKSSLSLSRDKWTKEEDLNLVKGIKQQFQDMLLQKTYQNTEIFPKKSTDVFSDIEGSSGSHDFDSIIALIGDHEITDENLRAFLPKVNWEQLASMYMKARSGAECESRWLNCTDPLINQESWTKSEEKKLLHIIQQKGISNWINIAASLGTDRTPFQCLAHYQRSLNPSILKKDWTEDEDDKLRAAVATYGESNWQHVASALEGWTGTQCSNRWTKSLHPIRKRIGKWIPDEDKRLKVAVILFGDKNWRNIAQYVPGRDHVQCRERWRNCLDPSLKLDEWSEEEDLRLQEAFDEHGPCWNKIAACIPPRTDNQCLRRWKTLFPHEFPRLQAARKIRKVALISNFVDREARRPALGPSDFVQLQLLDSATAESMNARGKRKRKPRLRSTKRKMDTQVSCESVSRLTNSDEVDNFSDDDDNLRKKHGKKRRSSTRKSSTQDFVTSSVDKALSTVASVDKLPAESVDTARKKGLRRKTRKSRSRQGPSGAVTGSEHAATEISNEKDENVRGVGATKNRKSLRLSRRKNQLMVKLIEAEATTNSDGIDVNRTKEVVEPCLGEHSDLSILGDGLSSPSRGSERVITNDDVAEPYGTDNDDERPLRCSTPDILDNLNSRASTVYMKTMSERSSSRDQTCSDQMQDTHYEDDMTLTSFIKQSRKAQKVSLSSAKVSKSLQKSAKTSDVVDGLHKGSKRLKTRSICSNPISASGDDMPLALYYTRLKKRKFEAPMNLEGIHP